MQTLQLKGNGGSSILQLFTRLEEKTAIFVASKTKRRKCSTSMTTFYANQKSGLIPSWPTDDRCSSEIPPQIQAILNDVASITSVNGNYNRDI